ncbi:MULTISPECIES: PHA/PHB synthase family protein [Agrobacterium tumefaciens complex]|jgi:polyhydroxyalkanoate synthase|uniref:Class I poly(R)-hydroxyalkanoic acid synthase n=1 Tax=Agrobacterium radiobacter TaxID=362 RepID=A0ABD5LKH5_AGRRD|nr:MULTISPECIES: class I poly(R)-hydroxyalkanoic acid synthase [Agrobacterium tumefaciens complex]MCP2134734.1 polyhydroxyalkanoate synthase [Rhizobium sp. SLBN-94]TGE80100.1 class I poly(R)-hydroxyalkanoic acid synthase [Rhizobium sp. SEMIA 439]KAA1236939.1 class I poly(R)-hydroxyalkanoic acid synthase [Agrobacterium tumefaciens]KAB0462326.1 class I poly(R)-hydroxyalkanoic acid synthase [Agrobacterium tumefaciens]KWT80634.1 poly(3-hydroxyalkanoate) synthetase [Agrobacterium radiobacter]
MAGVDGGAEKKGGKTPGFDATSAEAYLIRDPETFAINIARALENLGKAASEWLAPRERGEIPQASADPVTDLVKTLSDVAEYWMAEPKRSLEAQTHLLSSYYDLWAKSVAQFSDDADSASEKPAESGPAERRSRRFADADWQANPFFDFLLKAYQTTVGFADRMVTEAEGLDEHTRTKALFYMRQVTEALSPANFVFTNPQVFRETVASSGANLVKGMAQLAEDVAAGNGHLKLRQTDYSKFVIGQNIAVTPGKVVAKSPLCEIIHYAPTTQKAFKRPLLIVPPWINKFYILDLNPQKSFVGWCLEQGHSVFMVSWINPDARLAEKGWDDYIREGIDFALDTIEERTGERQINAIGYCVGGTLLSSALALHAQEGDERIRSATLLAAQTDFIHAGDLKVFIDEGQLAALDKHMQAVGYLDGSIMATVFNMLRASDLIWPYVVDNYLRGTEPLPFDLLYWNSDSTRVTAASHSFYLRNCYLENNLARGLMRVAGKRINLGDINIPVYDLATRDDHIAPAKSVFTGAALFGGPVEFVLGASGHIAGVVNPPQLEKYQYWTGPSPAGDFDAWQAAATAHKGSWWVHWQSWIENQSAEKVKARKPGDGRRPVFGDAPGTYVLP